MDRSDDTETAEPKPLAEPGTALDLLTEQLTNCASKDTAGIVTTLWHAVIAARECGLAAATATSTWRARQRNAEAVEFDILKELSWSDTLTPPKAKSRNYGDITSVPEAVADRAVAAIHTFCSTATDGVLPAARPHARKWPDARAMASNIGLLRSLSDCWSGRNPSYLLKLPPRPAPWWPHVAPARPGHA